MKHKSTWQGIGISSDPKIARDPISLHMLAYLQYGSNKSKDHLVVIGDMPQAHNYMALYDLSEKKAYNLASKKGKRKAKDIEKLCSAYGLKNIEVKRQEEISEIECIKKDIEEIFQTDNELKNELFSLIPERIKRKVNESNLERLSQYTIDEISMALSNGGIRISHPKQKEVDNLTQKLQEIYGIGNPISFDYPELGLEYVPKSDLETEPYSTINPEKRILVTDNFGEFKEKLSNISKKEKNKIAKQLKTDWNKNSENLNEFYSQIIKPGYNKLELIPYLKRAIPTAIAVLSAMIINGNIEIKKMEKDYQTMEYSEFKQKHESKLPPMFMSCFDIIYGDRFPEK